MQQPTPGRMVFFYSGLSNGPSDPTLKPYASTVAAAGDAGRVNLSVLAPDGTWVPHLDVPQSETPKAGCWSWPPRNGDPAPHVKASPTIATLDGMGDAMARQEQEMREEMKRRGISLE